MGAYLVLWSAATGWTLTLVVLVLLGVFYAATDGVLMALGGPAVPVRLRAGGIALLQSGQALGRLCASVMFGAAWAAWGVHTALALAAGALTLALLTSAFLLSRTVAPSGSAPASTPSREPR